MVAKILGYAGNISTEEWNRKVLFMADDEDRAGDFVAHSDAVTDNYLPALYQADKICYGENYTDPDDYTWQIDTSASDTTITGTLEDPSSSVDASFTFISNEPGTTFECTLDGGVFEACVSPKDYPGLSDGGHNFYVRATDAAGNPDPTPASYTWQIDTTPPQNIYIYLPLVIK